MAKSPIQIVQKKNLNSDDFKVVDDNVSIKWKPTVFDRLTVKYISETPTKNRIVTNVRPPDEAIGRQAMVFWQSIRDSDNAVMKSGVQVSGTVPDNYKMQFLAGQHILMMFYLFPEPAEVSETLTV